jgi:hypothetical protein
MKIKHLVEYLSELDPELEIVRPGYEGGYVEIEKVFVSGMVSEYYKQWWYGPHETTTNANRDEADFKALIIE